MTKLSIILTFILLLTNSHLKNTVTVVKHTQLMGCNFSLTVAANNETNAWIAIEKGITEIKRIEKLISSWDENSQTNLININAGVSPVKVSKELYELIYRSIKLSKLTDGSFDITVTPYSSFWQFDKSEQQPPNNRIIQDLKSKVSWQSIVLNELQQTVFLQEKGMKIGFGAIGKGYAADMAKKIMQKVPGIKGGIVNASGDLAAWGEDENSQAWQIQIADPKNPKRPIAWLSLNNLAIATSGNYEKYFTSNGKRYSHIINPKTGYPVSGIKSVSVITTNAEAADAIATSIFVLRKIKGLQLIDQLKNAECIIITDDNQLHTSKQLKINYY